MSKEKGKYFKSLYKTLYEFNINPIKAAGFKGGKYGQTISDAVGSGQTLAGLTEDQQIYMLEVMKNILYPKSRGSAEEGGSIQNLEFFKSLPQGFIGSLKQSARSLLESYVQEQDSSSNSSTTQATTTSVSTTSSIEKSSSSSSSSSTSELQTTTSALSTTVWLLGGNPIGGESTSPTITTSSTVKTITTSCSSTLLFSPLDPLIPTTESISSTDLVGENPITEAE